MGAGSARTRIIQPRVGRMSIIWALATLHMVAGGVADASAELIKPHAEEGQLSDLTGVRCGVDISGVLVKAVLARGAAFHRGEDERGHFKQRCEDCGR